jgi:hypothetical protein
MATLGANNLSVIDIAKRTDPTGAAAILGELLHQANEVIPDVPYMEANSLMGHVMSIRTALPTIALRTLNAGVPPTSSAATQVTESCSIFESWSVIDKLVAEIGGNAAAIRMQEAKGHLESLGQSYTDVLFNGDSTTTVGEYDGFAKRYNSTTANNGQNIILGGGVGIDNASLYLVGWGPDTVFGIYPKGTRAGIERNDRGIETVVDTTGIAGSVYLAYRECFTWRCGLAVKDWRYVVRVPNIDISNLVAKSSAADLFDLMIKATHRIPNLQGCRPVFYMNRTLFQMLDIQGRDDVSTGGQLTYADLGGRRQVSFRGIPVKLVDQLAENEALVA